MVGRVSRLQDEPHHAESVHAATWVWKGANHNYCVRQRKGWGQLRDLLIQVRGRGGWGEQAGAGGRRALCEGRAV